MKRSMSDSEDDFEDLKDGSPSQSCQVNTRKKRRGIIEKRRRDRINNSLTELRRLVPTAFEKQGSAKLEKAEILQMTVDHLKLLHQKGLNGYNIDPTALAMDYRSVGFRECAAEVARYLVTVEGLDIQDPLRLRLMSHLQCYSAQRDAASKVGGYSSTGSAWNSLSSGLNHSQYGSSTPATPGGASTLSSTGSTSFGSSILGSSNGSSTSMLGHQQDTLCTINTQQQPQAQLTPQHQHHQHSSFTPLESTPTPASSSATASRLLHPHQDTTSRLSSSLTSTSPVGISPLTSSTASTHQTSPPSALSAAQFAHPGAHTAAAHHHAASSQFSVPSAAAAAFGMPGSAAVPPSMLSPGVGYASASSALGQLRPYRPWGAELAY